jgi:phytoene dehydrogenase-like protein
MPADHGTPSGLPGSSPGTGARPHVGIIGGGMLGLGLASQLEKSGHRVTVFEAAPTLGGLAAADGIGDVTWDRFYHVTLLSDSYLRELLEEIGLGDAHGLLHWWAPGVDVVGPRLPDVPAAWPVRQSPPRLDHLSRLPCH